ncbi:MAG: hypothetical protein ACRCX2_09715 [Paraclostridium sp.]
MEINQILENNKLIAEFLGLNLYRGYWYKSTTATERKICKEQALKFHNDWNWLMKVIEKIRVIDSKAKGNFKIKLLHYHRNNKTIFDLSILEGKEYVYNAFLEFIKWYNENKED